MKLISVLTATHHATLCFLATAYASLKAQTMPPGWEWEWVLELDGPDRDVLADAIWRGDRRVSISAGARGGPAIARSVALARAAGDLVRNLDADDVLLPGALLRDIQCLDAEPSVCWTTSGALDFDDEHRRGAPKPTFLAGRIPRRSMIDEWIRGHFLPPVHPTTLCVRRPVLLALGGWMALPTGEDTGLLIALSTVSDGFFIEQPSVLYRKHRLQLTAQPDHAEPEATAARRLLTLARALALTDIGWTIPSRALE